MSVELYLRRKPWDGRVYRRVEDYDPVLRSHCGMDPVEEAKREDGNKPDTTDGD